MDRSLEKVLTVGGNDARAARGARLSWIDRWIVAAAVTCPWTGLRIAGINPADLLIVSAVIFVLLSGVLSSRRVPIPAWSLLPTVILFGFLVRDVLMNNHELFETIRSEYTTGYSLGGAIGGPVVAVARLAIALTAVSLLVYFAAGREGAVAWIGRGVVLGCAVSALAGLAEAVGFWDGQSSLLFHVQSFDRSHGLAVHPNALGQTSVLGFAVAIGLALTFSRERRIWLGLAAILMAGIWVSSSRAALAAGVLVVALCVLLLVRWRSPRQLLAVGMSLVAGALLLTATLERLLAQTRFVGVGGQQSSLARLEFLTEGWSLFLDEPILGQGVYVWAGESVALILLVSGGVVLFLVHMGSVVWALRGPIDKHSPLAIAFLVASLAMLAYYFFNNALSERYLYWSFAAYAVCRKPVLREGDSSTDRCG